MRFKRLMPKPSESPRSFVSMTKLLGGYHLWQSQDDNRTAPTEIANKKGENAYGKCIILCSYKQWQECDNK